MQGWGATGRRPGSFQGQYPFDIHSGYDLVDIRYLQCEVPAFYNRADATLIRGGCGGREGGHQLGLGVDLVHGAAAEGARDRAGWSGEVVVVAGRDDAARWVRDNAGARDAVLVKASRGAGLESVAATLLDPAAHPESEGSTQPR